jgi:DNA-binding CsgD family transcriptional regulator
VRVIVALLGEVIAAPGGFREKRRILMDRLCQVVDCSAWVWCLADYVRDRQVGHSGILHGGFDDARFAGFLEALNHPAMEEVSAPSSREFLENGVHITRNLPQLEKGGICLMESEAGPLWEKANIGTLMISLRPMEAGGASAIGLYRIMGAPHFTERETRIAHIVLSGVPRLHDASFPDQEFITRLYPRHRTILNLLCDGWSRKKIADHLKLSVNTVHGYTRTIFRHFGVHTQSELLSRFTYGDGGDR